MYQMEFTEDELTDLIYALRTHPAREVSELTELRIRFEVELDNTSLPQHVENWEATTGCKANGYMRGASGVMLFYDDRYWSDSETKKYERLGFTHHRL